MNGVHHRGVLYYVRSENCHGNNHEANIIVLIKCLSMHYPLIFSTQVVHVCSQGTVGVQIKCVKDLGGKHFNNFCPTKVDGDGVLWLESPNNLYVSYTSKTTYPSTETDSFCVKSILNICNFEFI